MVQVFFRASGTQQLAVIDSTLHFKSYQRVLEHKIRPSVGKLKKQTFQKG